MKKVFYILIFVVTGISHSAAQVEFNGSIQFTNTTDSLRNFYNVSSPDSLDQAVRLTDAVYQKSFDDEITVLGNTLIITTDFEFPAYINGMNIIITIPVLPDTINTPVNIQINQQTAVTIKTLQNLTVDNTLMKSGIVMLLIYDGNSFIMINQPLAKCPSGFKKMTDKYCIQKNRNPLATFWNAHKDCNDKGYHLCTFQEWYYACVNNTGLQNMPLNFEWVHSSSNHNIHALKIGAGADCQMTDSETTATTGLPMYYRCCYHIR